MTKSAGDNVLLDDASFRAIADLAYRESGLTLVAEKATMIQSRLRYRLRALKIDNFAEYCNLIGSDAGQNERRHLISALTTNVSHFFRENHHYDTLREFIQGRLPALHKGTSIRIWSAGCSNGQEAVSAAITILEQVPQATQMDLRILGTDIDPQVVAFARAGIYPERLMGGVSQELRDKYFSRATGDDGSPSFEALPVIRKMLRFNELNLLGSWPMTRPFDLILCRNVVIYFDGETQARLWPRFQAALKPDGLLFLGHSERIADPARYRFDCIGPTTYAPTALLGTGLQKPTPAQHQREGI